MSPILAWKAIALFSCLRHFATAGFIPYQEPVHFDRTFSQSSTSTSSTQSTTSSRTFRSTVVNQSARVVNSFPLSQDGVTCEYRSHAQVHQTPKSASSSVPQGYYALSPARQLTDLRPYNCHVQCFPGTSATPLQAHCQKIVNTIQKRHDSITIEPQTWIYVAYKDCALVLENTNSQNLVVMYDWNHLARQASRLQAQCTSGYSSKYHSAAGGTCFFSSCDVKKSQSSGSSPNNFRSPEQPYVDSDNSGIMITFQKSGQI